MTKTRTPNIAPECLNRPRVNDDGFEELCHIVTAADPDARTESSLCAHPHTSC